MSGGFVKLHEQILDSTVWALDSETLRVFLTMLLQADPKTAVVNMPVPALARRANVTVEACESALAILSAPDEYSRTKEHEGRRIVDVSDDEVGWLVVNFQKYRDHSKSHNEKNAERQRRWRERQRCNDTNVTVNDPSASASASASAFKTESANAEPTIGDVVDRHRALYLGHRAGNGDPAGWAVDEGRWSFARDRAMQAIFHVPIPPADQIAALEWAYKAPPWNDGTTWAAKLSRRDPAKAWARSAVTIADQRDNDIERERCRPKTDEERHRESAKRAADLDKTEAKFLEDLKAGRVRSDGSRLD